MIAAAISWLAGTRLGRWVAIAGGVVLALVTFGAWQRGQGRKAEQQRQKDNDHAAVVRAGRADSAFRADGAAKRLSDGQF